MKPRLTASIIAGSAIAFWASRSIAASTPNVFAEVDSITFPLLLLGIALLLVIAKLGGELFERLKQPAVLGELIAGIMLGNLMLLGFDPRLDFIKLNPVVVGLAEIGVILL